jgi:triacylglycerol lipase
MSWCAAPCDQRTDNTHSILGLYGFDVRGPSSFPSLQMHYWSSILNILRKTVGAQVIVTAVPGTGSITSRAEQLDRSLQTKALGRGINFMAHSMGGLDCRYLITHLKPVDYTPLSLTTIATPHRGSPFMDWCKASRMCHYYSKSLLTAQHCTFL